MRRALTLSDAALGDLIAARRWLTQPGAGVRAYRRLKRVNQALGDLRLHPCRWPIGEHSGVRERPVEGYRLLYSVEPDTGDDRTAGDVSVLRVFGPFQSRETP